MVRQDKHPSTRVILLLDGADRFLSRSSSSSSTVQVDPSLTSQGTVTSDVAYAAFAAGDFGGDTLAPPSRENQAC